MRSLSRAFRLEIYDFRTMRGSDDLRSWAAIIFLFETYRNPTMRGHGGGFLDQAATIFLFEIH